MTWTNPTDKTICVNADKSRVVQCDTEEAAFVLVGPGGELPDDVAKQYGLDKLAKAETKPGDKAEEKAEDKGVEGPAARNVPRR